MSSEIISSLSLAIAAVLMVALLCGTALAAWQGWLKLKRLELDAARRPKGPVADEGGEDTGSLIELAAVKERLRRLEAIANGVEL